MSNNIIPSDEIMPEDIARQSLEHDPEARISYFSTSTVPSEGYIPSNPHLTVASNSDSSHSLNLTNQKLARAARRVSICAVLIIIVIPVDLLMFLLAHQELHFEMLVIILKLISQLSMIITSTVGKRANDSKTYASARIFYRVSIVMLLLRIIVTLVSLTGIPNRYRYPILYDTGDSMTQEIGNLTTFQPNYHEFLNPKAGLTNNIVLDRNLRYINQSLHQNVLVKETNYTEYNFNYGNERLYASSSKEDKDDRILFIYSLVGLAIVLPLDIFCIKSGKQLKQISLEYERAGGPSNEIPLIEQSESNFVISSTIASSIYRSIALYSIRAQTSTAQESRIRSNL